MRVPLRPDGVMLYSILVVFPTYNEDVAFMLSSTLNGRIYEVTLKAAGLKLRSPEYDTAMLYWPTGRKAFLHVMVLILSSTMPFSLTLNVDVFPLRATVMLPVAISGKVISNMISL